MRNENHSCVLELIKSLTFNAVTNEKVIGYVSEEKVDSETISNFLDSLRFSNHNPSTKSPEYRRWIDYANSYHVSSFTEVEDHDDHKTLVSVKRCPYSVSAYLRFWKHVSNEDTLNENDLFVFDSPSLWRDFRVSAPSFHIVIRCGEKSEINVDTAAGEIKVNKVRRTPNDDQTLVPNVWGAAKAVKSIC